MLQGLRPWAVLSLVAYLSFLGATYEWFDADEFVNLQQARRVNDGQELYVETPSNHPPLYTQVFLRPVMLLPGSDLLAARLLSVLLIWGTGLLVADLFRRHLSLGAGRTFLTLWSLNGFALLAGTRAMNEVPLTALLVLSVYLLWVHGSAAAAGGLAGSTLLVRYTALFFLPALVPRRREQVWPMLATAAAFLSILVLAILIARPGTLQAMTHWTLAFHAERPREDLIRRLGKTIWWSGIVFAAPVAHATQVLRRPFSPAIELGIVAFAGALMMPVLPTVHVHYFLPATVVVTALTVFALTKLRDPKRQRALFLGFLLLTFSQAAFYPAQTPHGGLAEARSAAHWIEQRVPSQGLILTDAPQYAILAQRENWRGYYWSLHTSFSPDELATALDEVVLVAVSERFGSYDRGYPGPFLERLQGLPCKQLAGVRAYWTDLGTEAPPEFTDDCR